jgi:hypothetical protein
VSDNLDLAIANLGDDDLVAEVSNAALNLDAVVQELLKGRDIEDLVVGRLRSIDDELLRDLLGLATTGDLLIRKETRLAYCSVCRPLCEALSLSSLSVSPRHFGAW